jgi:hypothetical protein
MSESEFEKEAAKADAREAKAKAKALRPWFKKKRFILPIVFVTLIALSQASKDGKESTGKSSSETSQEDSYLSYPVSGTASLWDYTTKADLKAQVTPQKCSQAKHNLVSSHDFKTIKKRLNYLKKVESGTDRRALSFINSTGWASPIEESKYSGISESYRSGIAASFDSWLGKVFSSYKSNGKTLNPDDKHMYISDWESNVADSVIWYCKLHTAETEKVEAVVSDFNSTLDSVQTMSENVPWYPDGYNEWSDDSDLAWKWANGRSCNLGDSCWHVQVVSNYGCDSLYAELNIFDYAGNQIDYTNDLTSTVYPNSPVILEFSTYNSDSSSGRLSQLTCN